MRRHKMMQLLSKIIKLSRAASIFNVNARQNKIYALPPPTLFTVGAD